MQVSFVVFRPVENFTQEVEVPGDLNGEFDADYEDFMAGGPDYYDDDVAATPAVGDLAPNVRNVHLEVFQTGNVAVAKLSVHEDGEILHFMGDSSLSKAVDNDDQYWMAVAEAFQTAADHFYMMSE